MDYADNTNDKDLALSFADRGPVSRQGMSVEQRKRKE